MTSTDAGVPLLRLLAASCEEGSRPELIDAFVPLLGRSISGDVTNSNEGYVYYSSSYDDLDLSGTVSVYHTQQAVAADHLEVSIEVPLVYQLAPKVNALPAATLVLRK